MNGFSRGDIIVVRGKKPEKIEVGDVIVFHSTRPYPIIHRVVEINKIKNKYYFKTKGDHNEAVVREIGEDAISEERVIGRAVFKIPWLGYLKIWFVEIIEKVFRIRVG